MYSSRGNNPYGQQQPYSSQSSYAPQNLGAGTIVGGRSQESEYGGLRAHGHVHGHPSTAAAVSPQHHYGGQYNSVYGSAPQQISPMGKGSAATALEGRSNYGSSIPDSPKFNTDYVPSSSRGYGQKVDQLYSDRISEYPSIERRQYTERHSAYIGTDLPSETVGRYIDPVSFGHEHQSKMYDHMEQVLKAHALQTASVEGGARQADYLAARSTVRHPGQDPISCGGRTDPESHTLSMISGSSYGGQQTASILGAAPLRTVDDLIYAQSSSNPGYGVSLPPGRDYGAGKGLHRLPLESDYPINTLARASHLRVDDRKDDRITYGRELERREDMDFLREREKDREREKVRLREREQREREREKRERERDRERERERERREKEREHKRGLDLRRELTPPRASRDRRGPSLTKDIRSQRRESPPREVSNRPRSPVKEKRREYSCKVFSFSFVEAERDYLSLDKRYPRLYISPECSKVLVHWPRNNLKLAFHTPVSFEHDFVVEEAAVEKKGSPSAQMTTDVSKEGQHTIWNAKIILMSGLSQNAQAELSSDRIYDDRVPHFCNSLRFAVLKKNSSLMAIGGSWDIVDGGDPSVDDSSLIRTALRYAKNVTNLDLKKCQRWNRFLEIHYHRVGKDGLSSHKEVTVLYVPDLSECLPSLDSWREKWINHKKTVSERERQQNLKKEKPGHKDEVAKDKKKLEPVKGGTPKVELQKKKEPISSGHADDNRKEKDAPKLKDKENLVPQVGKEKDKPVETKDGVGSAEEEKNAAEKEKNAVTKDQVGSTSAPEATGAKPGKKKIIKRIVKKKVAPKKDGTEVAAKPNDVPDKEDAVGNNIISEVDGQKDVSSSNPPAMKTFTRKKIVKKPVQTVQEKDEQTTPEAKEPEGAQDKAKVKLEEATNNVVQETGTKTTVKKKVIKRVPKRKAATSDANNKVAEDDTTAGKKIFLPEQIKTEGNEEADKNQMKVTSKENNSPKMKAETVSVEKQDKKAEAKGNNNISPKIKAETEKLDKKEEAKRDSKDLSKSVKETSSLSHKVFQTDNSTRSNEKQDLKEEKERKVNDEKNESQIKANKVVKEKRKSDEPPRHPGFFLQTKGKKDSKLQSVSLSLDSLLDYSNKDLEESNFEVSLFAESLYEMLQYEMGCRLLAFLQKLRIKFVSKRNKGKRPRQETSKKENGESSSKKRAKMNEGGDDTKSAQAEKKDDIHQDDGNISKEEANATKQVDDAKVEDKIDEEEPEEDPEEDEEMQDADNHLDSTKEETLKEEKKENDAVGDAAQNEKQETAGQTKETVTNPDPNNKDKAAKVESETKGTLGATDKELLQAFRFFDRNRVGYVRVEDLRLIIHNLGKFLSHRDVKELVQSALLESNTGRDDRILYDKLVKMSVI